MWFTEVFYPAIDALAGEMKRRFLYPEMLQIAQATDTVLRLETHNAGALDNLLAMYGDILKINPSLLKAEMQIVEVSDLHCLKCFRSCTEFAPSAAEVEELKKYPNLFKVVQLALTLPVSSATCERLFSAMRRVRNYLRTTKSVFHFCHCCTLNANFCRTLQFMTL